VFSIYKAKKRASSRVVVTPQRLMLSFHADSKKFECGSSVPIDIECNLGAAKASSTCKLADDSGVTGGVGVAPTAGIMDDDATVSMPSEDEDDMYPPFQQRKRPRLDEEDDDLDDQSSAVSVAESEVIIVRKNSENKYCWETAFAEAFGTKDDMTKHRILGKMANKVVRRMDLPRVGNLLADRMAQAMMRHMVDNEHDIAERLVKAAILEIDWIGELQLHAREELEMAIGMSNEEDI
jgi:hypothetical protein